MTRIRIVPKWLSFLIPLSLSLAVLTTVGCGGDNKHEPPPPPVVKSSEAGIASLTLTGATLEPAWTSTVRNYGTKWMHTDVSSVSLTVTLKDTKARLFINDASATSGQARNIALALGQTSIKIGTVAEDGTSDFTTITINKSDVNTTVWVVDGIGGALVKDARVVLRDANGNLLESNLPVAANGKLMLNLDRTKKYNIFAKGASSAEARYANFDPAFENEAFLLCLPNYSAILPLEAPIIENVSFGTANNDGGGTGWKTMPNEETYVGLAADVHTVRVTAISRNPIHSAVNTYGAFFRPMMVNLNAPASYNYNGATISSSLPLSWLGKDRASEGTAIGAVASPVEIGGKTYYRTTFRAAIPNLQALLALKNHWLDIVVYDVAGNRIEQRVYLNITNAAATDATPLAGVKPEWNWIQSQTFGFSPNMPTTNPLLPDSNNINAIAPFDPAMGAALFVLGNFNYRVEGSTSVNAAIRGYEVWCSNGNQNNFRNVLTAIFATTSTAAQSFNVSDPGMTLDETMYFKIRVFNNNTSNGGYSQFSNVLSVKPMAPFTPKKSATHENISMKQWPTFKVTASNPVLMNATNSDQMNFTIYVKETLTGYPMIVVPFRLVFTGRGTVGAGDAWGANKPLVEYRHVTAVGNGGALGLGAAGNFTGNWFPAHYQNGWVKDGEGNDTATPQMKAVAWLDNNGDLVIDTDSNMFRSDLMAYNGASYMEQYGGGCLQAGASYEWSIYGSWGAGLVGTNPANPGSLQEDFLDGWNRQAGSWGFKGSNTVGTDTRPLAIAWGSDYNYSWAAPDGFYILTIHPDAE